MAFTPYNPKTAAANQLNVIRTTAAANAARGSSSPVNRSATGLGSSVIGGIASALPDVSGVANGIVNSANSSGYLTGGDGGADTAALDVQANPLLGSLGSLDQVLANRLAQARAEYDRAIAGYNAQDALDKQAYNDNVHTNEQNFTSGNQAALLGAANASTGLRGVLGSLGALAGSGGDVVNRLVGQAANSDLGTARNTFDTNAKALTTNYGQTEQQQRQRRADAEANFGNTEQNARADVLNSRQSILEQLANLYGAGTSRGNEYAGQATALAPQIAETSRANVAPYQAASSLYSPTTLQGYLTGTKNLNVSTDSGTNTPINSPLYASNNQKKDQLAGVA